MATEESKQDMPEIKSKHSLVFKHLTPEMWAKLAGTRGSQ